MASYTCSQINSDGLLCSTELFPANQNCSHSHAVDRPSCLSVSWWIFPMSHTLHPGVPLCLTVRSNTVKLHRTLSSKTLICVLTHTSSLSVTHTRAHENTQFASLMFKKRGKLKEISTGSERVNLGYTKGLPEESSYRRKKGKRITERGKIDGLTASADRQKAGLTDEEV